MTGPSGSYAPQPDAPWHLLAGDESALPAIGASLERLSDTATARVFAVVDGPEHEIELPNPPGSTIHWLHRDGTNRPDDLLVDSITAADLPAGRPQVFVHGEASETRAVRRHLLADRGLDRASASISPYWRRDHTDEDWREIKREFLADQESDVT
jgi:NADPH-dependent ferric siderophore reductase